MTEFQVGDRVQVDTPGYVYTTTIRGLPGEIGTLSYRDDEHSERFQFAGRVDGIEVHANTNLYWVQRDDGRFYWVLPQHMAECAE